MSKWVRRSTYVSSDHVAPAQLGSSSRITVPPHSITSLSHAFSAEQRAKSFMPVRTIVRVARSLLLMGTYWIQVCKINCYSPLRDEMKPRMVYVCLDTCCSHFLTIIAGVDLHFRHESKLPVCQTQGFNPGRVDMVQSEAANHYTNDAG